MMNLFQWKNKIYLWKPWSVLSPALLIFLIGLVSPSTAWAHQRVERNIVPPPMSSPLASIQLHTNLRAGNSLLFPGYQTSVESMVTEATQGTFLRVMMIVSSRPLQNGDLPNVAQEWNPATNLGEIPLGLCKVGSSAAIGTSGTQGAGIIPACPSSTNGTIDVPSIGIILPGDPAQKQQNDLGDRFVQAKLFSLPQYPDPNLHTDADWQQFRIGESTVKFLPHYAAGTPVSTLTPEA
jgi:hypothetical protein